MAREYSARMVELVEEGLFNKDMLIIDLLNQLSESDVKEFVEREGYFGFEDLDPEYDAHLEDQAREDAYCREVMEY